MRRMGTYCVTCELLSTKIFWCMASTVVLVSCSSLPSAVVLSLTAELALPSADLSSFLGVSNRVVDAERTLQSSRLLVSLWHTLPPLVSSARAVEGDD